MGPPHSSLWTTLKNPGQFCIGYRITGGEIVLECQFDPSLAFQRTEHLLEQNQTRQVGQR